MRMWMVDPQIMCNQHLLGEHVELHMLVGHLKKGRRIDGFLANGLLEPASIGPRHSALVDEMQTRGMNHKSEIGHGSAGMSKEAMSAVVDRERSLAELVSRCDRCAERREKRRTL